MYVKFLDYSYWWLWGFLRNKTCKSKNIGVRKGKYDEYRTGHSLLRIYRGTSRVNAYIYCPQLTSPYDDKSGQSINSGRRENKQEASPRKVGISGVSGSAGIELHYKLLSPPKAFSLLLPWRRSTTSPFRYLVANNVCGLVVKKHHGHCSFHRLATSIPSASVPTLASMA